MLKSCELRASDDRLWRTADGHFDSRYMPPTARRIAGLLRPFTLHHLRKLPQRTRGPIACGQQSEGAHREPEIR